VELAKRVVRADSAGFQGIVDGRIQPLLGGKSTDSEGHAQFSPDQDEALEESRIKTRIIPSKSLRQRKGRL